MAEVRLGQPGEPKVRDLAVELLVEQDVAGLDVSVVDGGHGGGVQVGETFGGLVGDGEAAAPGERRAEAVEVVEESSVWNKLVDHERLVKFDAAAEKADKAAVVDLGQDADLVKDLIGGLGVAELGALDGHRGAVLENALVDLAVAAAAEEFVGGEVCSGLLDLFAGEVLGGAAACIVGVEDLLPLLGQELPDLADAPQPPVQEEARRARQQRRAQTGHQPCFGNKNKIN